MTPLKAATPWWKEGVTGDLNFLLVLLPVLVPFLKGSQLVLLSIAKYYLHKQNSLVAIVVTYFSRFLPLRESFSQSLSLPPVDFPPPLFLGFRPPVPHSLNKL